MKAALAAVFLIGFTLALIGMATTLTLIGWGVFLMGTVILTTSLAYLAHAGAHR